MQSQTHVASSAPRLRPGADRSNPRMSRARRSRRRKEDPLPSFAPVSRRGRCLAAVALTAALTIGGAATAEANVALTTIATDPFTNASSQHKTIVEPDTFSFGSTIVAAAQFGRFFNGGASDIGWATSTDNGASWTSGTLPGVTTYVGGPYSRVSDSSVAYDARHKVWLISTLALLDTGSGPTGAA